MNSATTPIIVALLGQIGLAFAVFQANPKRRSNQCFLLLSMAICVWLMYRYFGLSTRRYSRASQSAAAYHSKSTEPLARLTQGVDTLVRSRPCCSCPLSNQLLYQGSPAKCR